MRSKTLLALLLLLALFGPGPLAHATGTDGCGEEVGGLKLVQLKNGSKEPGSYVRLAMLVLRDLFESDVITFFELREKCRNPNHQFFGSAQLQTLRSLRLVDENGQPHQSTRNVVLSCVLGEMLDMTLVSPYAGH